MPERAGRLLPLFVERLFDTLTLGERELCLLATLLCARLLGLEGFFGALLLEFQGLKASGGLRELRPFVLEGLLGARERLLDPLALLDRCLRVARRFLHPGLFALEGLFDLAAILNGCVGACACLDRLLALGR